MLRDTGFYHSFNLNLIDASAYGKNGGCNFFNGNCQTNSPENCRGNQAKMCNFYHTGKSYCNKVHNSCHALDVYDRKDLCYIESNEKYDK